MKKVSKVKAVKVLLQHPNNTYLQTIVKTLVKDRHTTSNVIKGTHAGPKAFFAENGIYLPRSREEFPEFSRPFSSFTAIGAKGSYPLHHRELMNIPRLADYGVRT